MAAHRLGGAPAVARLANGTIRHLTAHTPVTRLDPRSRGRLTACAAVAGIKTA